MKPRSHNLQKVRLPMVRAAMKPADFARKNVVGLVFGDLHLVQVQITSEPGSSFGGHRRWFVCPSCSARTIVIAFDLMLLRAGCRRCLHWRNTGVMPGPHVRNTVQIKR